MMTSIMLLSMYGADSSNTAEFSTVGIFLCILCGLILLCGAVKGMTSPFGAGAGFGLGLFSSSVLNLLLGILIANTFFGFNEQNVCQEVRFENKSQEELDKIKDRGGHIFDIYFANTRKNIFIESSEVMRWYINGKVELTTIDRKSEFDYAFAYKMPRENAPFIKKDGTIFPFDEYLQKSEYQDSIILRNDDYFSEINVPKNFGGKGISCSTFNPWEFFTIVSCLMGMVAGMASVALCFLIGILSPFR